MVEDGTVPGTVLQSFCGYLAHLDSILARLVFLQLAVPVCDSEIKVVVEKDMIVAALPRLRRVSELEVEVPNQLFTCRVSILLSHAHRRPQLPRLVRHPPTSVCPSSPAIEERKTRLTWQKTLFNSNIATIFPAHCHLPYPNTISITLFISLLLSASQPSSSNHLSGLQTSLSTPKTSLFLCIAPNVAVILVPPGINLPSRVWSPSGGTILKGKPSKGGRMRRDS